MYVIFAGGLNQFEQEVKKYRCLFVYFWEPSPLCENQTKTLLEVERKFDAPQYKFGGTGGFIPGLTVLSINIREQGALRDHFHVEVTPSLMVYYRGRPITLATAQGLSDRSIGPSNREYLEELAENLLNVNR